MPNDRQHAEARQPEITPFVMDLLSTWLPIFIPLNWKERVELLRQIRAQLSAYIGDDHKCRRISQLFTLEILKRIVVGPLDCEDQASMFLYSGDIRHRQAARAWFVLNRDLSDMVDVPSGKASFMGTERRSTRRYCVKLPIFITAKDAYFMGNLFDITTTGAQLEVDLPPPVGTKVSLEIPLLGRLAALVVWATATFVGLSFVKDRMVMASY